MKLRVDTLAVGRKKSSKKSLNFSCKRLGREVKNAYL
jgi:hypothetical protein